MNLAILKHLTAVTATVVAAVGVLLSAYAGFKTWTIAGRISRATDETLNHLQGLVVSVHRQSTSAVSVVATTRERVDWVRVSVERLSAAERADQPATNSILEMLDEDVVRRLEIAEEFIRTMQNNMRSASSALNLLDSLSLFQTQLTSSVDQRRGQLQALASSLSEISDLLEQVTQIFSELRSQNSIDPSRLEVLMNILARVDNELNHFESEVQVFSKRIRNVEDSLSDLQRNVPHKISTAATLSTVFFICFGCSQFSLFLQGCRRAWDKQRDLSTTSPAPAPTR